MALEEAGRVPFPRRETLNLAGIVSQLGTAGDMLVMLNFVGSRSHRPAPSGKTSTPASSWSALVFLDSMVKFVIWSTRVLMVMKENLVRQEGVLLARVFLLGICTPQGRQGSEQAQALAGLLGLLLRSVPLWLSGAAARAAWRRNSL